MTSILPLLILFGVSFSLSAQTSGLDKEVSVIVNDLVGKMKTKAAIKNVAISDFTKLDGTPTELGRYLSEQFSDAIVNANASFSLVDRGRVNFLLKEAGLDSKGLLDPNTVAKLGKLKGIDAIITGTLTTIGNDLAVNVKVLSLETAILQSSVKGNISRTPAIIELEGKALGGDSEPRSQSSPISQTKPKNPVPSAQSSFTKEPVLFECLECRQTGENVKCKFRITSRGEDVDLQTFSGDSYYGKSRILDDEGNDFYLSFVTIANSSGQTVKKTLVSNISTPAEFTFSKVNQKISLISKLEITTSLPDKGMHYFLVSLKNIPVLQN